MFSSKPKFNPDKCKVQLKMLISRIKLQLSKQTNLAKAERRVVAGLLKDDKEHQARIKVEQIIRADFKLESLELINNYTELLISRFNVLVIEPQMKPEIAEAVTALVYSGYLLGNEIPELKELTNTPFMVQVRLTCIYQVYWCPTRTSTHQLISDTCQHSKQ